MKIRNLGYLGLLGVLGIVGLWIEEFTIVAAFAAFNIFWAFPEGRREKTQ